MDDKAFMAKSNPLALAGALVDDESGDVQKPQVSESRELKVCPHLIRISDDLDR